MLMDPIYVKSIQQALNQAGKRHDTTRYDDITYARKRTSSQLNLPHDTIS